MKLTIYRQRRKSLVLSVKNKDELVVKAPLRVPIEEIHAFVGSKARWISKQIAALGVAENNKARFDFENFYYILGEKLPKEGLSQNKYLQIVRQTLANRVESIKNANDFHLSTLKFTKSVRNWGSFDSKGVMKLNYSLGILPSRLVDYVIIHEFCHSVHMNHSKSFWQLVEKHCKDYKTLRAELNKYGFLLRENKK